MNLEKIQKTVVLLLQVLLLLVCLGVVCFLGMQGPGRGRQESTVQTDETTAEGTTDGTGDGYTDGKNPATGDGGEKDTDQSDDGAGDDIDGQGDTGGQADADAQQDVAYEAWLDGWYRDEYGRWRQRRDGGNGYGHSGTGVDAGKGTGSGKNIGTGTNTVQSDDSDEAAQSEEEPYVPPTIMLVSDLHYMSSTTHDDGEAFYKMVEGDDGKISQYSDEMLDALIEKAIEEQPAALVLTGDITLNGEWENHEKLAEKLRGLQEAGVPVVVIPGNHDINNKNSAVYFGKEKEKAPYLESGADFYDIYHEFGYDQSPNRDESSLSYVYPLDATHWLLMLDTAQYDDYNHVGGRLKPETLAWLQVHLQTARENGIQVLPMGHHNLLQESRLYTDDCTLENASAAVQLLEASKVPLYISGHLHAQRIKKRQNEPGISDEIYSISEIVLSPYSMPPNQYGSLSWDLDDNMKFETKRVDMQAYAAAHGLTNPELTAYDSWAPEYLKSVMRQQVAKKILSVPDDLKERMASLYAELYYDYCSGNALDWDEVRTTSAWKLWQRVDPKGTYTAEIGEMIEDVRQPQHDWSWEKPADRG